MTTGAEPIYSINASAMTMANAIMGDGVTVVRASYTGPYSASATFTYGTLSPEEMGVWIGGLHVPITTGIRMIFPDLARRTLQAYEARLLSAAAAKAA
jgi:hypothetical protein